MDSIILDKVTFCIIVCIIHFVGFTIGYHVGKKYGHIPKFVGTIFVNPDADRLNKHPDFQMRITPEFINAIYDEKLANKTKYVVFEVKEGSINEDNGML